MKLVYNLQELIGAEILSRSVLKFVEMGVKSDDFMTLDFRAVKFISRSVADELCNIVDSYSHIVLANMSGDVALMYEIVKRQRMVKRSPNATKSRIKRVDNMKELSALLRNEF